MMTPRRTVKVAAAAAIAAMSSLLVMQQTIDGKERSRLEQIGHLQGRFGGTEQHGWLDIGETTDVSRHMCLVGVAGTRGEIRQALLHAGLSRSLEKTLKTQHGLKHFWTVANGSRKSAVEMTFADPNPTAQALDTTAWMAREPLDSG
jgi:hypothetical protein